MSVGYFQSPARDCSAGSAPGLQVGTPSPSTSSPCSVFFRTVPHHVAPCRAYLITRPPGTGTSGERQAEAWAVLRFTISANLSARSTGGRLAWCLSGSCPRR